MLRQKRHMKTLDPQLNFAGLWDGDGVKGGTWKKVMEQRCDEVGWLQVVKFRGLSLQPTHLLSKSPDDGTFRTG